MGADASCCDHRYAGPLEWEGPVPDEQAPDPGGIEYPSFNLPCSVPVPPREPTARGPLSGLSSSRWLVRRIPLASWLARLLRMADLEDARGCLLAWRGHCAIGLAAGVAPGSGGPAIVFHTPRSLRPPQLSVADLEPQRVADSRRGALVDSTNKPHGTPASPCLPGRKRLEAVYDMLEANGGRISHADLYQLSKVNASADSARVTAAVTSLVLKGGLIGRDDFARFFAKAVLPADPVESLSCIERLEEAARRKSSAKLRWGSLASLRTSPGGRPTPESSRRLQSLVDSSHLHSALDKRMEMSDMTDSLPEELRPPVSPECAMRPDASLDLDEWELALQRVQPGGVLEDDLLLVDAGKLAEHEVSMTPSPRGYEYDKTILSIY